MSKNGISTVEQFFFNSRYERKQTFLKFMTVVLLWAIIGCILGALLDKLIDYFQRDKTAPWQCFGFLVLELFITCIVFYVMLQYIVVRPVSFDEWMMNTFAGFLFSLTYFTSQVTLSKNADCAIP